MKHIIAELVAKQREGVPLTKDDIDQAAKINNWLWYLGTYNFESRDVTGSDAIVISKR